MFNVYKGGNARNTLKINACSGGIYKTYKESWFEKFNLESDLADQLFRHNSFTEVTTGKLYKTSYGAIDYGNPEEETVEVIVLQMIICGDMEVIAELIKKEDFDNYFEKEMEEK